MICGDPFIGRRVKTCSLECLKHAQSAKGGHNRVLELIEKRPEYLPWTAMKQRCSNPNYYGFERYGGRGITVCDRWFESFKDFLADMGPRPPGTSLDRIDNNRNYEPGNCRWATPKQQSNNCHNNRPRVEYQGKSYTISELAELSGIRHTTLNERLKNGWLIEKAVKTPVHRYLHSKDKVRT